MSYVDPERFRLQNLRTSRGVGYPSYGVTRGQRSSAPWPYQPIQQASTPTPTTAKTPQATPTPASVPRKIYRPTPSPTPKAALPSPGYIPPYGAWPKLARTIPSLPPSYPPYLASLMRNQAPQERLKPIEEAIKDNFRKLQFWSKAAVAANVTAGTDQNIYTRVLPTQDYTEVVIQAVADAEIPPNSSVTITPEISNDAMNWYSLSSFTAISPGGTYPKTEIIKYTTIAAFMKVRIALSMSAGASNVCSTIDITCVGRMK